MSKRRTAADALSITPNIADFISGGMPAQGKIEIDPPSDVKPKQKLAKAIEKDTTQSKPKRRVKRSTSTPRQETHSPAYEQTLAQARIQKSVRFLPQIIARFEEHCRNETQAGRKSPSIQDALNEALSQWLHASNHK
jgi:hypothetical protein